MCLLSYLATNYLQKDNYGIVQENRKSIFYVVQRPGEREDAK